MPKEFVRCVRNGGRVRTKDLGAGKYMHICYDKNGKAYPGEVLKRKGKKVQKKKESSKIKSSKIKKTPQQVVNNALATIEDLKRLKEHFENK